MNAVYRTCVFCGSMARLCNADARSQIQHLLPGRSAVGGGAVEPALGAVRPWAAHGWTITVLWLVRISIPYSDKSGKALFNSTAPPMAAAIGRFVNAIAEGNIVTNIGFAGALTISRFLRIDGQRSDGRHPLVSLEERLPGHAAIVAKMVGRARHSRGWDRRRCW